MSRFYSLEQAPLNLRSSARAIAAANNGALFDPSDMSYLYQDAAGTTPVTAVEQPVGLILDKSRGMMLGPELTQWSDNITSLTNIGTVGTNLSIENNSLTITAQDGGADRAEFSINNLVIGKSYRVKINAKLLSGNGIQQGFNSWTFTSNFATVQISTSEYKTYYFTVIATSTSGLLRAYAAISGSAGDSISISNISVRELYGNHATQSVTASRPVLSARKNILLATETLATQSVTTLAAQYTLSFIGTGAVTLSGTATGTLTGTGPDRVSLTVTPTAGTLTLTVSGSVTKAQLELGTSAGPYQRVNTSTDYDTDPRYFPKYLRFDGIDDYMNLPYIS